MHLRHKWKYHNKIHKTKFMEEECKWAYPYLRYCEKCGKVQKMDNDWYGFGGWCTLPPPKASIFREKVQNGEITLASSTKEIVEEKINI